MRVISGINYYYKLDEMIKECIYKAKENPFDSFVFIAEDKQMVEKRFFKYTHYLVNIEIMTWNDYLRLLQVKHYITHYKVIDNTQLTYLLLTLFHTNNYHCFHSDNYYPIINEMLSFIREIELNKTIYNPNDFSNQPKLVDFMNIYHDLKDMLDKNTYITLESLINSHSLKDSKQYLYIEADHLCEKSRQDIINKLANYHDITLMYTYNGDKRLFNLPFSLQEDSITVDKSNFLLDNLFYQSKDKSNEEHDIYTFVASTPEHEVKRVIYTILEMIIKDNLKYEDFMIVYPDSSYTDILLKVLNDKEIPHNLKKSISCVYDYSYQYIINKIDELEFSKLNEYAQFFIDEDIEVEYKKYFESLLDCSMKMSNIAFKDFFINTYSYNKVEVNNGKDVVDIVSIDKVKSSDKKYVFILGMNETILPKRIKDTGLLLDEDIKLLREHNIPTPLTTLERLGLAYNEILKALQCPYHTLTISYPITSLSNETKLPSSLYKQLESMYDLKLLPKNTYLSIDDYYLTGATYKNKDILNSNIQYYKETKNQSTHIDKDVIKKLYNPTLSVSQIETYNKCPYLYFIQYGLGIYPSKDNKLKPNELGTLIHEVLHLNIDQKKDTKSIIENYLTTHEILNNKIQSSYINQFFIEQLIKDIDVTLDVLNHINNISKFEVNKLEEEVKDTINGMKFKGYVDRIDMYNNYVSIIDYKSSAKDIDLNLAIQGFNIQMLIYLKMITHNFNKDPGAVLYFNTKRRVLASSSSIYAKIEEDDYYNMYRFGGYVIDEDGSVIKALDPSMDKKSNIIQVNYVKKDDKYKGHILTNSQLDKLLEEIEKHIYELYIEMVNGHIGILPKGSDDQSTHTKVNPCHYCEYKNVCHFDIFYNDYKLVEMYDMKEKLGGE